MSKQLLLSSQLVTVYVDGQPVQVPANANLIQACEMVGKYVPHYCWHPSLSVPGNCRLCLVKVEGAPKLVAGCHTGVRPDMKISTLDAEVDDSRVGMMEFLLANHPLDCPQCDRGGECSLQRFSMDYGAGDSRFAGNTKRRFPKPNFDPLISLERNRCIHCTRCIRFCDEIAGDAVMGMFGRGDHCYIGTYGDGPVSNIYSGNVIDLCPVGCLTNKPYRFKARPWELRQIPSVCTLCSSGCRVTHWMRAGLVYRTTPPTAKSDQFGKYTLDVDTTDFICNQGRFGNDFGRHADRLLKPQVRRDGKLTETTFEDAVTETAAKLKAAADKGRVGVLVSPRLTNEELFLAQLITRKALKSNNIDWRTRLPHAEAAAAYSEAQGIADGTIDAIEQYDVVVLVAPAAQWTVPVAGLDIKEAARRGQIRLYTAGPRVDRFFADQSKGSFAVASAEVEAFLGALAGAGDFPAPAAGAAAEALKADVAKSSKVLVAYDPGHLSGFQAVSLVRAVRSLKAALGEKLHTLPLIRESNASGAFFTGAQPDRIPAAPLDRAESRARYQEAFAVELSSDAGLSAPEMIEKAAAGELDALLVIGGADLFEHHPQADLVKKALTKVPFLAVADLLPSVASEAAHVVLPTSAFYEKTGTLLNVEGRVGLLTRAERPVGVSMAEFDVLLALGGALGMSFPSSSVAEIFKLLQRIGQTEGAVEIGEVKFGQARGRDPQGHLVFRGDAANQTPMAYVRRTEALNGFKAATPALANPASGLALVWDDVLQGRDPNGDRCEQRDVLQQKPVVEINPATAASLELHDRDMATLTAGSFSAEVMVKVVAGVAADTVWVGRNVVLMEVARDLKQLPAAQLQVKKS